MLEIRFTHPSDLADPPFLSANHADASTLRSVIAGVAELGKGGQSNLRIFPPSNLVLELGREPLVDVGVRVSAWYNMLLGAAVCIIPFQRSYGIGWVNIPMVLCHDKANVYVCVRARAPHQLEISFLLSTRSLLEDWFCIQEAEVL